MFWIKNLFQVSKMPTLCTPVIQPTDIFSPLVPNGPDGMYVDGQLKHCCRAVPLQPFRSLSEYLIYQFNNPPI